MRKRLSRPSPAMMVATTALAVAAVGTASGSWAAPSPTSRASAAKPTVVTKSTTVDGIQANSVVQAEVDCPKGTTVIGGSYAITGESVYAHANVAAVFSKSNSYAAYIVNPPGNPAAGIPARTAGVTVAALCAKNKTPIVVDGPFAKG